MLKRRQMMLGAAASLALIHLAAQAADTFPSRAVILVVPYSAGGLTDALARSIAPRLAERWGQPVVVENKPGGGTTIGTAYVARAQGDGHTLLLTAFGYVGNQLMLPSLPYDVKALTPLANMASSPSVLYVSKKLPVSNLAEFVAYGKANPGKLSFASSGNGSSPHIAAEQFAGMAGIDMVHVPYRGNGPAITDLLGGQVDALFDSPATMAHVTAGNLKVLGHGYRGTNPRLPGVPSISEVGGPALAKFEAGGWFGFFIPSSTPDALQERVYRDVRAVLDEPSVQEAVGKTGVDLAPMNRADFAAYLQLEMDRWGPVIRSRNIRPN